MRLNNSLLDMSSDTDEYDVESLTKGVKPVRAKLSKGIGCSTKDKGKSSKNSKPKSKFALIVIQMNALR